MTEQAFHRTVIGEGFPDVESNAVADEHYQLRCGMKPCRCTCRACLIRSLRYCEEQHLTQPKNSASTASVDPTERMPMCIDGVAGCIASGPTGRAGHLVHRDHLGIRIDPPSTALPLASVKENETDG